MVLMIMEYVMEIKLLFRHLIYIGRIERKFRLATIGVGLPLLILRHPVVALTMFGVSAPLGILVSAGVITSLPCARFSSFTLKSLDLEFSQLRRFVRRRRKPRRDFPYYATERSGKC